jgi:hypothetical protein
MDAKRIHLSFYSCSIETGEIARYSDIALRKNGKVSESWRRKAKGLKREQ